MRWIGCLVLLAACADGDTGMEGTDTNETTDTPLPTGGGNDDEDRSATLNARVVDADGTPVEAASVRFCRGPLCLTAKSDSNGEFGFTEVVVDWHSLEIIAPENSGLSTPFMPIVFETEQTRDVELIMPPLDPATPLPASPEAIAIGEGLTVELAAGELDPPDFVADATELAGVRLTEDQWVPVDDAAGSVVAQWFMYPFDHKPNVDAPLAFTNDYGLKDGTTLSVIVGDYTTSRWIEAGTLVVNGGELTGTANLPVTSTVVLIDTTAQ